MKTQDEVEKRLRKLLTRYRDRYVHEKTDRVYHNCVHNYEHKSKPLPYSVSDRPDTGMTPARKVLPVLSPEPTIHICMYGSKSGEWNGDVCDALDVRAPDCPWFKRRTGEQEAGEQFDGLMSNVRYVFDNYRDVAALQWVLDIRDPAEIQEPEPELPLWKRIVRWFASALSGEPPVPQLPPPSDEEPATEPKPEVPKGLWDADSQDPAP